MSRHGQCRCGTVLKFRKRHGYKRRCPACGKVVRLQADNPAGEPIPDAPDDSHLFEDSSEAQTTARVEDPDERRGLTATCTLLALATPTAAPPWTWQWLAVASGLVLWVGLLSILAWWWWQ